jgi:uncharacterized repeat protein (TIGR01451 family)
MQKIKPAVGIFLSLALVFQIFGLGAYANVALANNDDDNNNSNKVNICHKKSEGWDALHVSTSGWGGHSGHSSDFLYEGPTDEGKPDGEDHKDDNWCSSHIPPKLTVTKTVVNIGGGTKVPNDFVLKVDSVSVLSGIAITSTVGSHAVSETNLPNYTSGVWGGNCNASGQVTLAYGDNSICTITNTYVLPTATCSDGIINQDETGVDAGGICTSTPSGVSNTCFVPATSNTEVVTLEASPSGENTLQTILNSFGVNTPNASTDQKSTETWNIAPSATSVTFKVTILDKQSGNNQNFGYYKGGNNTTFTSIFSVPTANVGDTFNVTIPATFGTSIGFAINTSPSDAGKRFSETALNTDSSNHTMVYNPLANVFALGFEDLLNPHWDRDYNDIVVKISDVVCNTGEVIVTDPALVKTLDNGNPAPGAQVVYTLVVSNTASIPATNIVVTDPLPTNVTYVSNSSTSTTVFSSGTLVWTIASIGANASATLLITANVNPDATGSVANTASITSGATEGNSNTSNDSSTAPATVTIPTTGGGGGDSCTTGCDGQGGDNAGVDTNVGGSSTGGSNPGGHRRDVYTGGGSPQGSVLGASTEAPGLPNTGNGASSSLPMTIATLAIALFAINTIGIKAIRKS